MWQLRLFDCAKNDLDTRFLVGVIALNFDVGMSTQECYAAASDGAFLQSCMGCMQCVFNTLLKLFAIVVADSRSRLRTLGLVMFGQEFKRFQASEAPAMPAPTMTISTCILHGNREAH
jgi:hypothetical protein